MPRLPLPPIDVPWIMKPLASADTSFTRLDDDRVRLAIRHETLRGVTPDMLVWWFQNMDGTCAVADATVPSYRVWHPRDHVKLTYVRPARDGRKFGPGAKIRIQEFFNADPRYCIDVVDVVDHLDETGFRHRKEVFGVNVMEANYQFAATAKGTLYTNDMILGIRGWRFFNRHVRPRIMSDAMARAWLTHNVEEVGNFEHFLPDLYARR